MAPDIADHKKSPSPLDWTQPSFLQSEKALEIQSPAIVRVFQQAHQLPSQLGISQTGENRIAVFVEVVVDFPRGSRLESEFRSGPTKQTDVDPVRWKQGDIVRGHLHF